MILSNKEEDNDNKVKHKETKESRNTRILFPLSIYTDDDKKLMKVYDNIIFQNEDILIDRSYTTLALIRGFVSMYYDTIKSGKQLISELGNIKVKPILNNSDDNGIPIILPPANSMRKQQQQQPSQQQQQKNKKKPYSR